MGGADVAVGQGYAVEAVVRARHPAVRWQPVSDDVQALRGVAERRFAAAVVDAASLAHVSSTHAMPSLRATGSADFEYTLSYAVRKDWPELRDALDAAIRALPATRRQAVVERWIGSADIAVPRSPWASRAGWALLAAGLLAAAVLGAVAVRRRRAGRSRMSAVRSPLLPGGRDPSDARRYGPRPRTSWSACCWAVLYTLAASLSLALSRQPGSVANLWFANAVTAGFLATAATPRWPGLLVASLLANLASNLTTDYGLVTALTFLPANAAEALLAAVLLRRSGIVHSGLRTPVAMLLRARLWRASCRRCSAPRSARWRRRPGRWGRSGRCGSSGTRAR
ncbi:MAG: transporter substrate-binding domain-containing protein [Piscinibacter sp.]